MVIAKVTSHADKDFIQETAGELGVTVIMSPYRYSGRDLSLGEKAIKHLGKLRHPLYLDGAAYEYAELGIQNLLKDALDAFKPDVVWFEYTYLWPLYRMVRRRKIPIITRSINFEPEHFLEEDGYTLLNYLKFVPKFFGEWLTVRLSDVVLAITPKEEKIYRSLGGKCVLTLPLRGLPRFTELPSPKVRDRKPLHAFFMGSSYTVAHNKAALSYILKNIAPRIEEHTPGGFVFHVLGKKVPREFEPYFNERVIQEGYKHGDELESFLTQMDVAVVPSLMGAGQQQKVFEPIIRGFPTVTSPRPIAGYALRNGEDYIAAHTAEEFVQGLFELLDVKKRTALSKHARAHARTLFNAQVLDATVVKSIDCTECALVRHGIFDRMRQ